MDIALIANPVASQFTGGAHRSVMSVLASVGDTEAMWPASATEATGAARAAVELGARVVVAMGGDGMVHHVSQALIGADTALGIIPTGTTNVVARLLGIPMRPARAARLIVGPSEVSDWGATRMTLTRGSTTTTHHSMFACGLGLDALVVAKADKDPYRKYRFGSLHYATTAFGVAFGSFPSTGPHLRVSSGDRSAVAAGVLLQFREVYTYFGRLGLQLAGSSPDPITALVIHRLRRSRIPQIAFDVFMRRDLSAVKGIDVWEGVSTLRIEADLPVAAQADGEGLGMADAVSVEWREKAIRVVRAVGPKGP